MKATVKISEDLNRRLKIAAAVLGQTKEELVERLIENGLAPIEEELEVFTLRGFIPGVS